MLERLADLLLVIGEHLLSPRKALSFIGHALVQRPRFLGRGVSKYYGERKLVFRGRLIFTAFEC
jgi:hypothetical protein